MAFPLDLETDVSFVRSTGTVVRPNFVNLNLEFSYKVGAGQKFDSSRENCDSARVCSLIFHLSKWQLGAGTICPSCLE